MFVEYLGIPGCGKTFFADLYKKRLELDNKKFKDVSRKKSMSLSFKIFYKFMDFVIYVIPKYRKQVSLYRKACIGCRKAPKYIPFSLEYCIKDIVLASLLHDVFGHSKNIILNDEGQLQRIVFLAVQYNVPFDKLLIVWQEYKSDIQTKYIRISPKKAFLNIKKRDRHVCPMDELNDTFLQEYLEDFYTGCEDILQSGCIENCEVLYSGAINAS